MGFSRQEYWSGLPFSTPGHLPDSGIEPVSPAWHADSLLLSHQGNQGMGGTPQTKNMSHELLPIWGFLFLICTMRVFGLVIITAFFLRCEIFSKPDVQKRLGTRMFTCMLSPKPPKPSKMMIIEMYWAFLVAQTVKKLSAM